MNLIGRIGGRKFLVAGFGLIAVVVLALTGVDIAPYSDAIIGIAGSYLVGQGVADGLSGGRTASTTPAPKDVG